MPRGREQRVIGDVGTGTTDPFERDDDGLLLAESFARLDLDQPRRARAWFLAHGAVNLRAYFPDEYRHPDSTGDDWFDDRLGAIASQQANVRWHLQTLARLTLAVDAATSGAEPLATEQAWDAAWAGPVIRGEDEHFWLGAETDRDSHILDVIRRHEHWDVIYPDELPALERIGGVEAWLEVEQWWPRVHEVWRGLVDRGVPILWVPLHDWREHWARMHLIDASHRARAGSELIDTDRQGLIELQRRLLRPYIERAAAQEVAIELSTTHTVEMYGTVVRRSEGPIQISERRVWTSILAPVYLQLLEGLRRVSEGHRGAAWCRECGEPFLALDARRSAFCNDKERFRHSQRERRHRLGLPAGKRSKGTPS
jgi:hypothetical protein